MTHIALAEVLRYSLHSLCRRADIYNIINSNYALYAQHIYIITIIGQNYKKVK